MGIEDEIKPVKDLLELLAKFETAPQGKEDDYVYHGTSTDKLKGIISSNGLKGNLNPALEKIGKHADKFLKYTNPELYNKGFSRTKGVYAFVDTNFHLDRSSASGEQLIFKINASGLDAIVLDMNMVTEASHGLNDYMDYKRTESTELPFPEEKRKEFLIRFKKFIKEYWGKAVYLRDFKKRFKLTDKTDYLLTYSDGETTINDPEVLIKGDVPLNHLQIYSYPESIQQLFSKIGVSTAKEALALVQSNDKENKEDKEIPDMTTETFNLKENDMLYNPKTKTQRIVQGVHGDNVKVLRIDRRTGIQRTEVHSIERINRYLSNGKLIHQGNLGRKPVTQKQEDEYQEAKSGQIKRNNTATEKRMRENIPNILSHMKAGDTSRDWRAMLENYRSYAEKNGLRDLEDDIDKAIRSIFEETEPEKPNKTEIVQNITQKRISDILLHMHEYDLEEAEYALKTLDLLRKNSKKNNLPATILAEIDTTIQAVKTQEEIVRTQGPMTNEQMQGISVQRRIKNAKMAY
ncbi:hypothetical protein CL614_02290, partial [archaeon]|nr:hypothetical protein [archaeon]